MIRRVNKVVSVVSLLLCILMLAGWCDSFWVCDAVSRSQVISTADPADTITRSLFWENGLLGYAVTHETFTDKVIAATPVAWHLDQHAPATYHPQTVLQRMGFNGRMRETSIIDTHLLRDTGSGAFRIVHIVNGYTRDTWTVPGFLPVVFFAIFPAIRGFRRLRRRGKSGLCRNCSYDLTGNSSGVCPECGTSLQLPDVQPWR